MSRLCKLIGALSLLSCAFAWGNNFNAFTGKVIGKNVRLRAMPDLESYVIRELGKNDLIVITGEKGDFYEVQPLTDMKAYVFRSFVLDNVVEGNRVNVRLFPDLEAPVIAHLTTGTRIDGNICSQNNKWLEIAPPQDTRFFVAKEFIENIGSPDVKTTLDKRKSAVNQLLDSSSLLAQAEMLKPFEEVDRERVIAAYQHIIDQYSDFPSHVEKARDSLNAFTESYLQKKIAYLEKKTSQLNKQQSIQEEVVNLDDIALRSSNFSATDRMKTWERIEESIYLAWSAMHHAKTMDDFYADQKLNSISLSGVLDTYLVAVKNRPGDFILREKDMPIAYLYSTHVNLQNLVGKRVNLVAIPRSNNSFAFPAFYVLDAE